MDWWMWPLALGACFANVMWHEAFLTYRERMQVTFFPLRTLTRIEMIMAAAGCKHVEVVRCAETC